MEIKTTKNYLGEIINITVDAKSEIFSYDEPNIFSISYNKFDGSKTLKDELEKTINHM